MAYTEQEKQKIIDDVCSEIENGKSLRASLCMPNMPARKTFLEWIDNNEKYRNQYARACDDRAETIFEDILKIADTTENDIIEMDDGKTFINHDVINRAKLRIDSRKWMLGKMNPKKYGDKMDLSSSDGSMSPKNTIITTLTEEQLMEALKQ